jgi:hypothetical protein
MEKQAKQTQSLLAISQEQRRTLEEANAQLHAELDGIYAASLAGAAGGVGLGGSSGEEYGAVGGDGGFDAGGN